MQTPIYLVVETSGSNLEHDFGKLEVFLEEAYNDEMIADGTIAQDSSQQASIWNLRESISEGLRHAGTLSGCSSLLFFVLGHVPEALGKTGCCHYLHRLHAVSYTSSAGTV